MKGENLFEAGGDGGSDNIAMQISDKCQYKRMNVVVYCATLKALLADLQDLNCSFTRSQSRQSLLPLLHLVCDSISSIVQISSRSYHNTFCDF